MEEQKIKEAFSKVKEDIFLLQSQITELKRTLDKYLDKQSDRQTLRHINPTQNTKETTESDAPTHSSTDNLPLKAVKSQISNISIGNEGVSTDRQTDRQTDTSTRNQGVEVRLIREILPQRKEEDEITKLEKVSYIINSLDDIKKDLRQKIKRLTNQEMAVLVSIYQLEEKGLIVDYFLLSKTLQITESSIRDYVQRLLKKGFPLDKIKENNKKITLKISENLRKIAPLQTILRLKEL